MRQILWLALAPLTAFWLYSVGIYSSYFNFIFAIISIVISVIISAVGLSDEKAAMRGSFAFIALPAGIACLIIPYPYNAGLIIIALALVIYLLRPRLKALWLGMLFSGTILSIQMVFLSLYYILAPSHHKLTFLSSEISVIFNTIGIQAASKDGVIFIYGLEKTFPFTVTAEQLGIYPLFLIFIGAVFLVFLSSRDFNRSLSIISTLFLISLLYIIFRYIFLVSLFLATDMPQYASSRLDIFIEPNWLLFSFLPLILIFLCRYPIEGLEVDLNLNIDRNLMACFMLILLGSLFLMGAFLFQDPGIEKKGRVLVDEIHSICHRLRRHLNSPAVF
jgi:hypothetical protein